MSSPTSLGQATPSSGIQASDNSTAISSHQRAVLDIKAPVWVALAQRRMPLEQILSLVPGSILSFDKSCEEPLDVVAGGVRVATGEAIKVGDKYGVRIRQVGPELQRQA